MKHGQRVQAAMLCLGFVLLLVLTQVFALHVRHHHCVGEDCVVCHQMQHNQQQLSQTAHRGGSGQPLFPPRQGDTMAQILRGQEGGQPTLISLNVKLSN